MKTAAAALTLASVAGLASADIIVTEIFYNLNGSEGGETEWVEIYNTGSESIDLSGWSYGDSQDNIFTGGFAAGTTLGAGQAAVITFQAPSVFRSIWGEGIQVIQVDTAVTLANSASPTNETVAIRDAMGATVDEVNYESSTNGWPGANGVSITLLPSALDSVSNDLGENWAAAVAGVNGAYVALIVNPDISNATALDIASPGAVPTPGAVSLLASGLLVITRRRRV